MAKKHFQFFRYLAICHPLYSYTMSGLRRASKIIAVVWILALSAAIPYAVFTNVHYVTHPYTNKVRFHVIFGQKNTVMSFIYAQKSQL